MSNHEMRAASHPARAAGEDALPSNILPAAPHPGAAAGNLLSCGPSLETAPVVSNGDGGLFREVPKGKQFSRPLVRKVTDLAKQGFTRRQIAAAIGTRYDTIKTIVRVYQIPCTTERPAPGTAKPRAEPAVRIDAKRRANPHQFTEAQKRNLSAIKARAWSVTKMRHLPPVTDDEAERLTREWLARNKPTICEPAAIDIPCNAGMRFK